MELYEAKTIRMKESGNYVEGGASYGYEKGQVIHVPLKSEYARGEMMPRTAALMLRLGRAEVVNA